MKKRVILALLLLSVSFLNSQNCFTSHVTYSSSAWPTAVHSADFNSDGYKDIIAATVTNNDLQLYLGSSSGTFSAGSSIPIGTASWDLVSGDFNGDGKRDLAAACSGTGSIVVLLGNGLGTFTSVVGYAMTTPQIVSLATADFNNDGNLDIVGEDFNSGVFYRILGAGNGTFGSAASFTTGGTNPYSLCTGDFNSDGNQDVAIANGVTNNVGIAFGTGTGSFVLNATYSVGPFPQDIISADFNNDGKLDLASANINGGSVSVLLGSTAGTFAPSVSYPAGSTGILSMEKADFNGDGNLDIVGANFNNSYVEVYLNNGSGVFSTPKLYGVGTNPNGVFAADFNNDGKADLVTSNKNSNTISVLLNYNYTISASPNFSSICIGNSTTLTALGASTYTWNTGSNLSAIAVSPTTTSNYTVVGQNTSGCTHSVVQTITVNALPSLTISAPANTLCLGKTATLSASGASTYTWNPGTLNGASINPIPLSSTVYSVSGTNGSGCVSNTNTFAMTVLNLPTVTVNSGSICSGQNFTMLPAGASTYTVSGGTTIVSPVINTSYSVTGTSTAGCISSNTAVSTVSVFATPTMAVNSGSICSGQTLVLIGTGANSYTWNGVPNNFSISVSPTITSSYSVVGSSSAGCISSNTAVATVSVFAIPTVASNSGSICSTKSFTILPSGANSYTITGGTFTVSPLSNSNYSITGTSTAGCVSNNTAVSTVSVFATPTMAVNSGSICNSQTLVLIGTGANSYTWNGVPNNFSISVSPTITSTYSVIGSSTAGCISTNTAVATVTVFASPTLAVNSGSICSNNSFTIIPSGANTYTVSGGSFIVAPVTSTNYSVTGASTAGCISSNTAVSTVTVFATPTLAVNSGSICNGQSFTLVPSGANTYTYSGGSSIISPASTTNYSVTGSSTAGCVSGNTAVATVTVNAIPTVAVNSGSICSNASFTLVPTGANTYTVSGNNFTVSPIITTNYSVTGTSTAGCVSTNSAIATITVEATPTIAVNSGSICSGQTLVLTASGANTYSWNAVANSFSLSVNPNTSTSYSVTGTSTAGCISAGAAVSSVTVEATPTISVNSGSICSGDSFTIIPAGALNYTFSSGSNTVNPLTTTSYSVIGTSTAACVSANAAISTVTVIALPTVSINATNTFVCQGLSATLTASGANTYSWNTGSGNAVLSVTPSTTTNYSVLATALSGCTNTAVQSVSVNALTNLVGSVTSTAGNVTGIVILYKKSSASGQWDSITNVAINSSAFAFNAIPSASYAVLAVPTQTDLLETYGGSAISWQGASLVSHSCIVSSTQNINVVPILNIGTGPGSMSGQITEGVGFGNKTSEISAGNPIGGISVKGGKNPGGNVVGKTKTNANGDYVLDSLPITGAGESYFILVDIPGLDTNGTYRRLIVIGSDTHIHLDFTVDSVKINPVDLSVGVKELALENGKLVVYPNPSSGQLNVDFTLLKSIEISIDVTDLSGRVIKTLLSSVKQDKGEVSVRAQLNDLNPGVYFVRMGVGDEQRVTKWIVTE